MEFLFNQVVRKINNYTKQTICDEMNTSKETEAYYLCMNCQMAECSFLLRNDIYIVSPMNSKDKDEYNISVPQSGRS